MLRAGKAEAAAEIWRWQDAAAAHPAAERVAWRRAAPGAAIGLAIALLLAWWGPRWLAALVTLVTGAIFAAALVSPRGAYPAIERGLARFADLVGSALTWVFMPLLFYLVFLPFGLLLRRGKHDSLKRFYEPAAPTYWVRRDPTREATRSRERPF